MQFKNLYFVAGSLFLIYLLLNKKMKFLFPLTKYTKISSPFGNRIHPITGKKQFHNGIDIPAPNKTPILAPQDGTVNKVFETEIGGLQIILTHKNGYLTGYAHLSGSNVKAGDKVKKGEIIGYTGNTGRSTGPHLHFTVTLNGKKINPINVLTYA